MMNSNGTYNNVQFDFSDLERVWNEITEKYTEKYLRSDPVYHWKTIYNSDDVMIDISENKKNLRISIFANDHFQNERILDIDTLFASKEKDGE